MRDYFRIQEELQRVYGKSPKIIAVSKTKPYEVLREAYILGIRVFGENYIPEAIDKFSKLYKEFPESKDQVELHHIGPTQTGTLRKLFGFFYATHGVGSFSTAKELLKRSKKETSKIRYFLQINATGEDTKNGISMDQLKSEMHLLEDWNEPNCEWLGFMVMGPSDGDLARTEEVFRNISNFRSEFFPNKLLSMGMSNDYELALGRGSDCLRLGSILFGNRTYV